MMLLYLSIHMLDEERKKQNSAEEARHKGSI